MKKEISQAKRMEEVALSGIRKILARANELEKQGRDVIHFDLGEPDFDTPQHIKDATIKALDKGEVHYPPIAGIDGLKKAISGKLKKENGLEYLPEEVIVTTGVAQGMLASILCFLNEGEEILIPDPGYLSYIYIPKIAQGIIKTYSLNEENNFQIDKAELKSKITEKTKIIVLISPNNPTGSILERESLSEVADLAKKHNLLVISDEIYERLIYGDEKNISIASFPGMKGRTIVLNGFSKYFAMTGWRLGYIAADKKLIDPMFRFCFYNTTSSNSFAQWGAMAGLTESNQPSERMKEEYRKRRDYLVTHINKIDKLSCLEPKGAFYLFVNIKKTGMNCEDFANYLLEEEEVATVPGINFGKNGEGFIRMSYATSYENIVKAIPRIEAAVSKLT